MTFHPLKWSLCCFSLDLLNNRLCLGLEWISSHQCTSCGWARWGPFPDERKSHAPLPWFWIFFPPLLYPKIFPPPTYHLPTPPPSLHRQSSRDVEQERAWSLEWLEPDPRRTQVSIFFFVFILFVCLWRCATQDTQRCSAAPQTTFAFSSSLCCKKRRRRRRRWHHLLLLLLLLFCATQEVVKNKATTT